jgi:hypothetical protein
MKSKSTGQKRKRRSRKKKIRRGTFDMPIGTVKDGKYLKGKKLA